MKSKSFDLTPLLDVVLILLFGLLVSFSISENKTQETADQYATQLSEKNQMVDELKKENTRLSSIALAYERIKEIETENSLGQYFFMISMDIDESNRYELILNDQKTNLYLSYEDLSSLDISTKKQAVKNQIRELIKTYGTGKNILVTLYDYGTIHYTTYEFLLDTLNELKAEYQQTDFYINENRVYEKE